MSVILDTPFREGANFGLSSDTLSDLACLQTLTPADFAAKCRAKCKHSSQRKPDLPKVRDRGGIGGQVFADAHFVLTSESNYCCYYTQQGYRTM